MSDVTNLCSIFQWQNNEIYCDRKIYWQLRLKLPPRITGLFNKIQCISITHHIVATNHIRCISKKNRHHNTLHNYIK